MAIKNATGEKCTPKQLAKEAVVNALKGAGIFDTSGMTEKEVQLCEEQLEKVKGRVLKILGSKEE